jgi:hypothetical protein
MLAMQVSLNTAEHFDDFLLSVLFTAKGESCAIRALVKLGHAAKWNDLRREQGEGLTQEIRLVSFDFRPLK